MYRSRSTWKVMHFTFQASIACVDSDGSRASDRGGGGGGGHPDPEIRRGGGGLKKNFFGPSGLSLVQK